MKKEEILAKARAEKSDEMEKAVRDRSAIWAVIAEAIAAAFFMCMRDESEPIMDLTAIVCFSTSVCLFYRFFKLKQIWYLLMGLLMTGLTAFSVIRYFQGH